MAKPAVLEVDLRSERFALEKGRSESNARSAQSDFGSPIEEAEEVRAEEERSARARGPPPSLIPGTSRAKRQREARAERLRQVERDKAGVTNTEKAINVHEQAVHRQREARALRLPAVEREEVETDRAEEEERFLVLHAKSSGMSAIGFTRACRRPYWSLPRPRMRSETGSDGFGSGRKTVFIETKQGCGGVVCNPSRAGGDWWYGQVVRRRER